MTTKAAPNNTDYKLYGERRSIDLSAARSDDYLQGVIEALEESSVWLRWLPKLLKIERRRTVLTLGALLLLIALQSSSPLLLAYGIDRGVLSENPKDIYIVAAAFFILCLISAGINRYWILNSSVIGQHVAHFFRVSLFRKLQYASFPRYISVSHGYVISVINTDVSNISFFIRDACLMLCAQLATLISACFLILYISPLLGAVVILGILPVIYFSTSDFQRNAPILDAKLRSISSDMDSQLKTMFSGRKIFKAYNKEQVILNRFQILNSTYEEVNKKYAALYGRYLASPEAAAILSYVLIIFLGGYLVLGDRLSVGELLAIILFTTRVIPVMRGYPLSLSQCVRGKASLRRVIDLYRYLSEGLNDFHVHKEKAARSVGSISFNKVIFSYDGSNDILSEATFTLKAGEPACLIGESGAGKSTIVRLISGLLTPSSGEIYLNDPNGRELNKHDSISIGMVSQEIYIFDCSVRENLLLGSKDKSDRHILDICISLGLKTFLDRLDQGLETIVNQDLEISQSERQAIAIARVILMDPDVLIFDESVSQLDSIKLAGFEKALIDVMKNKIIVLISHTPFFDRHLAKVISIKDGLVREESVGCRR